MKELKTGQKIITSGYHGTIVKIHDGELSGMIDVSLDRGITTVDIHDVYTAEFCGCHIKLPIYHGKKTDNICPICHQPAPCPMEAEKTSGTALPKKEG